MNMKIDFEKVGIITAYFAENTKGLYVTKLLKLFYYLDFISYKLRGASVSNDIYIKYPYGPVPSMIKNEIDLLSAENIFGKDFKSQLSSYVKLEKGPNNGNMIVGKGREYSLRRLANSELELMKCLAETFKNTNAKTLSNQTHKEKPWLSTSDFSVIEYELAKELDVSKIIPAFSSK